jgi:hypothetical protein
MYENDSFSVTENIGIDSGLGLQDIFFYPFFS